MSISDLPAVNATLNGLSTILLLAAYTFIRAKKVRAHAWLMVGALLSSVAFLTCYVIYHLHTEPRSSGLAAGLFRTAYLSMLFSHVVLAVVMVPMILMTLWRAYRRQWDKHRKIARPTFWIWIYVSITGVLIYLILYHLVPRLYPVAST